jgi:hypothetical protein
MKNHAVPLGIVDVLVCLPAIALVFGGQAG